MYGQQFVVLLLVRVGLAGWLAMKVGVARCVRVACPCPHRADRIERWVMVRRISLVAGEFGVVGVSLRLLCAPCCPP